MATELSDLKKVADSFKIATEEEVKNANIFGTPVLATFVKQNKVTQAVLLDEKPRVEEWENRVTNEKGIRVGYAMAVSINGKETVKLIKIEGMQKETDLSPYVGKKVSLVAREFTPQGQDNPVPFVRAML